MPFTVHLSIQHNLSRSDRLQNNSILPFWILTHYILEHQSCDIIPKMADGRIRLFRKINTNDMHIISLETLHVYYYPVLLKISLINMWKREALTNLSTLNFQFITFLNSFTSFICVCTISSILFLCFISEAIKKLIRSLLYTSG